MKNLHTKKLNRQQLRSIMAGLGTCPQPGEPCDDTSLNCISLVPAFCINGIWTEV